MLKFLQSGNWGREKGKCGKRDQCSVLAWFSHCSQETGTGHRQDTHFRKRSQEFLKSQQGRVKLEEILCSSVLHKATVTSCGRKHKKKQTKPGCGRSCVWRVLSYELACRDWAALGTLRLSRDSTLHLLKAVPGQLLASAWWFLLSAFDHGWVSSLYLLSYDSIISRERLFGLDLLMKDWVLGQEGVRTRGLPRWGIQTFCPRMWGPGVVLVNLYVMGLCWPADSLSSKEH